MSRIQNTNELEILKKLNEGKERELIKSPSFLRMEDVILNGKTVYEFSVLQTGKETRTEVKLDKNDTFIVNKIGLFLYLRDRNLEDEAVQVLQTYVNENYFVPGPGFSPIHLEAIYNGKIEIKRGVKVILENFDTHQFRYVGVTQQSVANFQSSREHDSGFVEIIPSFRIPGREQVKITLSVPTFSGILWQNTNGALENRVVLIFKGFLIKGASL
jgi:hypothetical protein